MTSIRRFTSALALACGLSAWIAIRATATPDLRSMTSPIQAFASTMNATNVDTAELTKISKDYARSYEIKTTRVLYRSPNHLKIAGKLGFISVVYVINGDTKEWKYGPIRGHRDVADAPGQKQGLLDFGILTADQLDDYTWKFVREEKSGGTPLDVFELRFKNVKKDPSRRLLWVDPARKVVVRRQTYSQFRDNVLKLDMRFEGITAIQPGIWAPTIVKVYNREGALGAVSRASDIRVNHSVPLSEFEL